MTHPKGRLTTLQVMNRLKTLLKDTDPYHPLQVHILT